MWIDANAIKDLNSLLKSLASGNFEDLQVANANQSGKLAETFALVEELQKTLTSLKKESSKMNVAAQEGDLNIEINVAPFKGDFLTITEGINTFAQQMKSTFLDINDNIDRLAKGDFTAQITSDYQGAFSVTKIAVNTLGTNLNNLIADSNMMNAEAIKGNLDATISTDKYQGDFSKISGGINAFAQQIKSTFLDINDNVDRLANGDFTAQITSDYQGAFNVTKRAINTLGTNLNNLIVDSNMMNTEAIKGNLDAVISTDKYQGDFSKISGGINTFAQQMKTTFLDINNNANKLARGDLTAQITNNYQGAFNDTKVAINTMATQLLSNKKYNDEQNWMKDGISQLNTAINESSTVQTLTDKAISLISRHTRSGIGALYLFNDEQKSLFLASSYAFVKREIVANTFAMGSGIVGQVAFEKQPILLDTLTDDQCVIMSATTQTPPNALYAYPLVYQDTLVGVIELGSYEHFSPLTLQYLDQTIIPLSASLNSMRSKELTEKLYLQATTLSQELQRSNAELEEQQQALEQQTKELEQAQQESLEQNREMEAQNTILEQVRVDLDKRARDLEESNKYKSEFLANMSHELRTPLNSILLLSSILSRNKKQNLDNEQVKQLSVIHSAGDDLLHLINDILDLSKIEAKMMSLSVEQFNLSELLTSVYDMFKPLTDDKNLNFSIELDQKLPQIIISDKEKIRQIIKNFISNAIKFTNAQGDIIIKASLNDHNTLLPINLSIIDSGIGISQEKQDVIFEAFKQADGSTSRKYGGTGLGLSISKELTHLLGGHIYLESNESEGSTFGINLPLKIDTSHMNDDFVDQVDARRESFEKTHPLALSSSEKQQILIVEDDENYASMLSQKIIELGYSSLIAKTGFEAIELTNQHLPQAILLDIHLPDFDGWEVLRLLKNDIKTRHIPIKIISCDEPNILAQRLGALTFVQKPVDDSTLTHLITDMIDFSSASFKRILVVEDDPFQQQEIISLLQGENIEIIGAQTPKEAIKAVGDSHFDCAIIDLNLPQMSGFKLLELLRKNSCTIPVIVYTAKDLSAQEIAKLRKYEATIILKTADSYRRLLEEVSIFLHRTQQGFPTAAQKHFISDKHSSLVGKTALIVDDDFRNIYALSTVLEDAGLSILTAPNGEDGLEMIYNNPSIDIVLMDIMMPVMDGYEAMKKIRSNELFANLPIIALTAKAQKSDREKCIKAGANDYLTKPIDHEQLLTLMKLWLNNKATTK